MVSHLLASNALLLKILPNQQQYLCSSPKYSTSAEREEKRNWCILSTGLMTYCGKQWEEKIASLFMKQLRRETVLASSLHDDVTVRSLQEVHRKTFHNEDESLEVRPPNVKPFDHLPHQVCLCIYHDNVQLLLVALAFISKYRDFILH